MSNKRVTLKKAFDIQVRAPNPHQLAESGASTRRHHHRSDAVFVGEPSSAVTS